MESPDEAKTAGKCRKQDEEERNAKEKKRI